ncbi:hypothetical protein BZL30_7928 [Mycobacterium kansasii]|uniref:Uncharacterized protein n=1 Tax=Mycobacterium kansasii TaxID=1768 RepID=A0A1V3WMF0_MYCKA|nr:hypothetical protein BZL30_7928 [Mycobacterium kansasii]
MNDLARHGFQHRAGPLQDVRVAADHERQRPGRGTLDTAGHRRVELVRPCDAASACTSRASLTEIVELSMNSAPGRAAGSTSA